MSFPFPQELFHVLLLTMGWKILYIFWRIIGICPFGLKNWRTIRVSYFGVFQSVIYSFVYFASFIRIAANKTNFFLQHQTSMNKIADVIGHTLECAMIITIWISFGIRQKRLRMIQKTFFGVIENCKLLAIQETHSNVIKKFQCRIAIVHVIWFPFYVINMTYPPINIHRFFTYIFCTSHFLLPNFIMIYFALVTLIREQFRSLNCKLREIVKMDYEARVSIDRLERNNRLKKTRIECFVETDPLAVLGRIHTEMVNLSRSIISFLSLPLYFALMVHLVQLSSLIYTLTHALITKTFWIREHWTSYLIHLMWFFIHIIGITAEIAMCDSVTEEANRARDIVHEALILKPSRKRTDSVKIWSLRLLQEPLTIDLFGIIEMKYSVIYKILGLTVAYSTLLIQMDNLQS